MFGGLFTAIGKLRDAAQRLADAFNGLAAQIENRDVSPIPVSEVESDDPFTAPVPVNRIENGKKAKAK